MNESDLETRIRRQRNLYGVLAVLLLVLTMAATLPTTLKKRHQLESTNNELLQLQATIHRTQDQITRVETQITKVEAEINAALKRARH